MFGKKKNEGGLMDVIRCDEPEYLIWKWRPKGADLNTTSKENSIRFGSPLQIKEAEVAVFVHDKGQDFIEGPYTQMLQTSNFPVLASLMGLAFNGQAPFRGEVYFINMSGTMQLPIATQFFEVVDPAPEFSRLGIPVSVRGAITFRINDYKAFTKKHSLKQFDLDAFKDKIRSAVNVDVQDTIARTPEYGIPLVRLQSRLRDIRSIVHGHLKQELEGLYEIVIERADIDQININKEHPNWIELEKVALKSVNLAGDRMVKMANAQDDTTIQNMQDMQRINATNMEEMSRIQREEAQHAQRMQTDSQNFALHQLNAQTRVAMAGADALGRMGEGGAMNMGGGGGGGMNPAGMMTGMMMGGAVAGQMTGMMGNMMTGMQQPPGMAPGMAPPGMQQPGMQQPGMMPPGAPGMAPPPAAPPPPQAVQYNVAVNGQTTGPFGMDVLAQMVQSGQLTPQSQVWAQGMSGWAAAETVQELSGLFAPAAPDAPPAAPGAPPPPPPAP